MRRKNKEMKDLMRQAVDDLGKIGQKTLVGDIFEIYFIEQVQKMRASSEEIAEFEDKYLYELCEMIYKYGDKNRVLTEL